MKCDEEHVHSKILSRIALASRTSFKKNACSFTPGIPNAKVGSNNEMMFRKVANVDYIL